MSSHKRFEASHTRTNYITDELSISIRTVARTGEDSSWGVALRIKTSLRGKMPFLRIERVLGTPHSFNHLHLP